MGVFFKVWGIYCQWLVQLLEFDKYDDQLLNLLITTPPDYLGILFMLF